MTVAPDQALRDAADRFHEIVSAIASKDLLANTRNAKIADALREKLRSCDQIKKIAADGFEVCVCALSAMGATDVTIHECGQSALGEQPWSGGDE